MGKMCIASKKEDDLARGMGKRGKKKNKELKKHLAELS